MGSTRPGFRTFVQSTQWYRFMDPLFRPFSSNIEYDIGVVRHLAELIPKKFEVKNVFNTKKGIETFKNRHPMENGRIYFDKILHGNCFLFKKTTRSQSKVEKIEFQFPKMSLLEIMAQKMNVTKTEFGSFVAKTVITETERISYY